MARNFLAKPWHTAQPCRSNSFYDYEDADVFSYNLTCQRMSHLSGTGQSSQAIEKDGVAFPYITAPNLILNYNSQTHHTCIGVKQNSE